MTTSWIKMTEKVKINNNDGKSCLLIRITGHTDIRNMYKKLIVLTWYF